MSNGQTIAARDAGVGAARGAGGGAVGNSPILHDNEQLGDGNNSKEVSIGVGFRGDLEEPGFDWRVGVAYHYSKLTAGERAFLSLNPNFDNSSTKSRLGILGALEYDAEDYLVGIDGEIWFAADGNGDRTVWGFAPWVALPLDGVYYQDRRFFTEWGVQYRLSGLRQQEGFAQQALSTLSIFDDRIMHTLSSWLEITRNVQMRLEINNTEASGRSGSETEWLLQWAVSF